MPSFGASPFCTTRMPFMPALGRTDRVGHHDVVGQQRCSCSLTVCEKIAAVLLNDTSDEMSTSSCIVFERVGERARHRVAGHRRAR